MAEPVQKPLHYIGSEVGKVKFKSVKWQSGELDGCYVRVSVVNRAAEEVFSVPLFPPKHVGPKDTLTLGDVSVTLSVG